MAAAVHTNQGLMKVEDLQQQARDFHIPEFSPPWSHQLHPGMEETRKAADDWAQYHFRKLVETERFSKIMASNINTLLTAGVYNTGPVLEEALERILAMDEKWALAKRDQIDKFLALSVRYPGKVDYSDELTREVSPITSSFRNLWKRASSVMPEDWSLRFAHVSQRDMFAMFMEAHERNLSLTPNSISEYIQERREYGFVESSLIVGELAEGIHVSSAIYYSPPMQRLVQAANDVIVWHNDIQSFQKELLTGEVNLVNLISKREGCSYNRAAEIVNGMVVERCEDLSLAATELRHHSDSKDELFPDSENAEKYILLWTNFISATHDFHQRSSRFSEKLSATTGPVKNIGMSDH